MIIDCHGHVSAPAELWAYKASVLSHRGAHGKGKVEVSDDDIRRAVNKKEMAPKGHLDMLKTVGVDLQLISPRPFQMMASAKPGKVVHWFVEETNNIIHRQTQLFPGPLRRRRRPAAGRGRADPEHAGRSSSAA